MDKNKDKLERPEINPGIYDQLIYNKGVKNMQWWKDSLLCGTGLLRVKEWNQNIFSHHK